MKNSLKLISTVLLSGTLALPALAQVGTAPSPAVAPAPPSDSTHPGDREHHFAEYLKKHPGIQGDLQRDPALVRDDAYLKAHPDLNEYFAKHPGVAEAFRAHPSQFMQRVNSTGGEGQGPY